MNLAFSALAYLYLSIWVEFHLGDLGKMFRSRYKGILVSFYNHTQCGFYFHKKGLKGLGSPNRPLVEHKKAQEKLK